MAPAYMDWRWNPEQEAFREIVTDFTIHNDVGDWSDRHGYYLILVSFRGRVAGRLILGPLCEETVNQRGRHFFAPAEPEQLSGATVSPNPQGWV